MSVSYLPKTKSELQETAKRLQKKLTALNAEKRWKDATANKAAKEYRRLVDIEPRTKEVKAKLDKAIINLEKKRYAVFMVTNEIYRINVELSDIKKKLKSQY